MMKFPTEWEHKIDGNQTTNQLSIRPPYNYEQLMRSMAMVHTTPLDRVTSFTDLMALEPNQRPSEKSWTVDTRHGLQPGQDMSR